MTGFDAVRVLPGSSRKKSVLSAIALIIATSVLSSRAQSIPDLFAYYPLASNAQNEAGSSDGVVMGDASFSDGALRLDGASYVNFGSSLCVTGSLSISLWLNARADDKLMRLIGRFSGENDRDICLFLANTNRLWIFLSASGNAEDGSALLQTTVLPAVLTQQSQHLAVTWDAALGSAGIAVYSDGTNLPTTDAQAADFHSIHAGAADLTLGAYDVSQGITNAFQGSVSQLSLFRGVLTQPEIQDLRDLGRIGNHMAELAAYLPDVAFPQAPVQTPNGQPGTPGSGNSNHSSSQQNHDASGPGILFVDCRTGDDTFNGAHASVVDHAQKRGPTKTMNRALNIGHAGATIYVAGGEYNERVNNTKARMIATGRVVAK